MANLDKMPCKYETFKDLHDRLEGCIVLYRDFPYFVRIGQDAKNPNKGHIFLSKLDAQVQNDKSCINVSIDDPDLDISATDLGYINYFDKRRDKNEVVYAYRTTAKRFKQALFPQYVQLKSIEGEEIGSRHLWSSRGAFDFFIDNYPSLDVALKNLGRGGEVAISRDVAMRKTESGVILVYLRMKEVGWIGDLKNGINWSDDASWVEMKYVTRFPWRSYA